MGDATKPCIVFIVLSAAYLSSLLGVCYIMFCEYCTEFTGLDCTLPAQCDVYMCPVLSLHYCYRNVLCTFFVVLHYCQCSMLCMFCSCCTTVSAGCYVLLVCVHTTCQCRVLCMSCFVLHYCQRSVPCMSCLCYSTSSAVCYVCLVCVALLPAKCATVEHCKRSVPLLNTASAVCRC